MMHSTRSLTQRRSLVIFIAAGVLTYILWNVSALDFILYPLRLFVTFVHEAGHGIAALVTGGHIGQLQVFANGSGVATTAGGARWLILPAGYVGAAAFGAALFFIAHRVPHSRVVSGVLGVLIALIAVLYTPWFSTAWLVGVGMGVGLIALGYKGGDGVNLFVLNLLSIITSLNAVYDLIGLIQLSDIGMAGTRNDAAAFSAEFTPILPAWFWAIIWAATAIMLLGAAIYYGVLRPRRRASV